jgi:hypothetical protein
VLYPLSYEGGPRAEGGSEGLTYSSAHPIRPMQRGMPGRSGRTRPDLTGVAGRRSAALLVEFEDLTLGDELRRISVGIREEVQPR